MSRYGSNSLHQKTLGYFLQGVPVVFLEIESIFGSNKDVLEYLELNSACEFGRIQNPALTPTLCRGYERSVTVLHEIRHFHDALLCRPLFDQFLLRNETSWCMAQLIRSMPRDMDRIQINWGDSRLGASHRARLFKELIFRADEAYFSKFQELNDAYICLGHEIRLDYLIETNAIVTELLHLYKTLGVRSVRDYYGYVVSSLQEPKYTLLLACFCELYGDVIPAVIALYAAIPFCLYSSLNPTKTFCELAERCKVNPALVHSLCNASSLKACFENERELEEHIRAIRIFSVDGPVEVNVEALPDPYFAGALIQFHRTMYDCRKKLIDKYIVEFNYAPGPYYERLSELPLPPLLFYPDVSAQGEVRGVREQEFQKRGEPLYKIAASQHPEGDIVFAGLTSLSGTEPAVRFEIADIQLAYAYFYKAAFEGKTSVYTPVVDHMYERTLREFGRDL
jgi:hypothetical protein